MTPNARTVIERRAFGAILSKAFMTWPTAVTGGVFVGAAVLALPPLSAFAWVWLPIGLIIEGLYLFSSMRDPDLSQQAVARMFAEQYNPASIRSASARQRLQKALDYKGAIDRFIGQQGGAFRASMQATTSDIDDWIGQIYRLARNMDNYESNSEIDQNRRSVPSEIANLKKRLAQETDPGVQSALKDAIQIRQQLLDNLEKIGVMARRAEIQMDNTLAQLGTIYAQMQLIDVKALDGSRSQRIRHDIQEQIAALSDTISAMDDVYQQQPGTYQNAVQHLSTPASTAADDADAAGTAGTTQSQSQSGRTR